jgi:hypothetical protein
MFLVFSLVFIVFGALIMSDGNGKNFGISEKGAFGVAIFMAGLGGLLLALGILVNLYVTDTGVLMEVLIDNNITEISKKYTVSRHIGDTFQREK